MGNDYGQNYYGENDGLRNPFEFPFPAGSARLRMGPAHQSTDVTSVSPLTLFSSAAGTRGLIRNLSMVLAGSDLAGLLLNIKYDGESSPSFSMPIRSLIGVEYPALSFDKLRVVTKAFEITDNTNPGGTAIWAFNIRLPIPYTNGIVVYLTETGADTTTVFSNLIYQDRLPGSWNARLRLMGDRTTVTPATSTAMTGKVLKLTTATNLQSTTDTFATSDVGKYVQVTWAPAAYLLRILAFVDARNVTVDSSDTIKAPLNTNAAGPRLRPPDVFFSRPAGEAGYVALITFSMDSAAGYATHMESDPRLYIDNDGSEGFHWTSMEDFVNGAFFFDQAPVAQGNHGGETCVDALVGPTKGSFYKSLWDYPVVFRNGIVGDFASVAGADAITYNWNVFYYKVV